MAFSRLFYLAHKHIKQSIETSTLLLLYKSMMIIIIKKLYTQCTFLSLHKYISEMIILRLQFFQCTY